MTTTDDVQVQGTCDERFAALRRVLETNLASGNDVGASVAVTLDGELVVDIWGGWVDPEHSRRWDAGTITNVWSTTKTMTNLCALILADAGEIDFDAPVARYWPEFAAAGKADRVLVRHIMSHTAGLPGWDQPMTVEDLYDWDKACAALAAQETWWEPGTASGYHAITQGYLVGEVVRRVTGQSLGTFFRQTVAEPLGADFYIGLDPSDFGRVSNVIPPPDIDPTAAADIAPLTVRALGNPMVTGSWANADGWRRAEIPAANGHGNARSVATIQAVVANGGAAPGAGGKEVRLLSEAGVERILEEQYAGKDLVLGVPLRLGLGYGLPGDEMPINASGRACYWGGYGGSAIIVDMERHMTVAYMMNRMEAGLVGDERAFTLVAEAVLAAATIKGA
jgi:CubicO group peptidase (beta-lactamase class C family)